MASLKYFLLSPFLFLCLSYTFANGVFNYDDGLGFYSLSSPTPDLSAGPEVDRGVSNIGIGPKAGPRAGLGVEGGISNVGAGSGPGPKAGPGVKGEISNVDAPRARPKASAGPKLEVSGIEVGPRAGPKGVDPIVNGFGIGVGVGYRSENLPPGFGGPRMGLRPGPGRYRPGPIIQEPYDNCMLGYVCPTNGPWGCSKLAYGLCESYNFHPLSASTDLHEIKINWAKSKPDATAQHGESGPVINIDSAH